VNFTFPTHALNQADVAPSRGSQSHSDAALHIPVLIIRAHNTRRRLGTNGGDVHAESRRRWPRGARSGWRPASSAGQGGVTHPTPSKYHDEIILLAFIHTKYGEPIVIMVFRRAILKVLCLTPPPLYGTRRPNRGPDSGRQCSNVARVSIGMHRNAPLSPTKSEGARIHHSYGSDAPCTYGSCASCRANSSTAGRL
jgi:hypothetical protein